jgi:Arc/MetJ family transcription regulator
MRTTVTLDDDLLAKAIKLTGGLDRATVLREGLKALIERESALRLSKLGGTQPQVRSAPRRRMTAAT